jgi:arsenite methyltransferase
MDSALVELLVDPIAKTPLVPEEGELRGAEGRSYSVRDGIPRLVAGDDEGQTQTARSFEHKWRRRSSWGSDSMHEQLSLWIPRRYGFGSTDEMRSWFAQRPWTLDAGCGAGQVASLWLTPAWADTGAQWVGLDISAAIDVARDRLGGIEGTHFVQADLLALPFRTGAFDAVFAEGVLHHTPSTRAALKAVAEVVRPGGELLFYVYRRKSPLRELADDYVRDRIAGLPPDEAWELLVPLTRLAQALVEARAEIEVPEDVELLGIPAGRHDVQRLVYWHFAKLFWHEAYSLDENVHVNFDWYHPRYAHRQSEEEVRSWCEEANLEIVHLDGQESGFTVRAIRASS